MPRITHDIKIAHIISALGRGGMEYAVSRLVIEQNKIGYPVHVICIRNLGPTADRLKAQGVPVHFCSFRTRLDPLSLVKLRGLLLKLGVNVVQTHNYRPNVSGTIAAKIARIPAIISSLRTVNRWDTYRQFLMDGFLCQFRDAIVCVSQEVRNRYREKIKWCAHKLHVIHNGIDSSLLNPMEKAKHLYKEHNLSPGHIHIVSIARLVKIKDHETLLRGFQKIAVQMQNARLLLLGEGPLEARLRKLSQNLGIESRVRFLGHQDNIAQWLTIADISVLSTHIEGFSSTILESMAAGVPVIATAVGGNLEAIKQGVTGFLTPHQDADALAEKALLILQDKSLQEQLRTKARKEVEKSFTIRATARKTLDLYQAILQKKGVCQKT